MKPNGMARHFLLAFLLALVGYALFYQLIEHRRTRKGPWQVMFTNSATGPPAIIINQSTLGITNVQISFPGERATNAPSATLLFGQPKPVPYGVPFGECVFMDTTFQPGTVTFRLFGHEIELLPRVLIVDHEEWPWKPNGVIALSRMQSAAREGERPREP
jgi:hypothetical protein